MASRISRTRSKSSTTSTQRRLQWKGERLDRIRIFHPRISPGHTSTDSIADRPLLYTHACASVPKLARPGDRAKPTNPIRPTCYANIRHQQCHSTHRHPNTRSWRFVRRWRRAEPSRTTHRRRNLTNDRYSRISKSIRASHDIQSSPWSWKFTGWHRTMPCHECALWFTWRIFFSSLLWSKHMVSIVITTVSTYIFLKLDCLQIFIDN